MLIDGEDVTHFSEKQFEQIRRKITMVFQSGALFDSLTVAENIAFPLEDQPGITAEDVDAYVAKFAHMLEVDRSARQASQRTFDRLKARRGHRARAGAESRGHSL